MISLTNNSKPHRLIYFFIWSVRVKGMTFGLGPLFNALGKGASAVKGLFYRKQPK